MRILVQQQNRVKLLYLSMVGLMLTFIVVGGVHKAHAAIVFDYRTVATTTVISGSGFTSGNLFTPLGYSPSNIATTTLYAVYAVTNVGGASCNPSVAGTAVSLSVGPNGSTVTSDVVTGVGPNVNILSGYNIATTTFTAGFSTSQYYYWYYNDSHSVGGGGSCGTYANASGTYTSLSNGGLYSAPTYVCIATDPTSCFSGAGAVPGVFIFPSSTYSGPDFSNWVVGINNIATNTTYYGRVDYQIGNQWTFVQNIDTDFFNINSGNATSVIWTVPKSKSLFAYQNNNGTSSYWTALLSIATSSEVIQGAYTSSSQVSFLISPFATTTPTSTGASLAGPFFYNPVQQNASWEPQSLTSSSALLGEQCPQPQNNIFGFFTGADEYYAFCSTINFLFIPSANSYTGLQQSITNMQYVSPFSFLFGIASTTSNAASSMTSSTDQPISFWLYNLDGSTSTVVLLPANASQVPYLGTTRFLNDMFNLTLDFAVVVLIALMYEIGHHFLHLF